MSNTRVQSELGSTNLTQVAELMREKGNKGRVVMCEVLTCNPAEIGSNHEVTFNLTSNCTDGQPRVDSHDGILATCPNYSLLLNRTEKYKLTLSKQHSNYNILTLMIYNISMTRQEYDMYFIIDNYYTGLTKRCTISFYHKAKYLKCSSNITKDGFRVDCLSSEMYPGGLCVIETNLKYGNFKEKDINVRSSNSPYISKQCTLSVPVAELTDGKTAINVTVYPNVTGKIHDKYMYGTNTTLIINLERPSVRLSIDTCPSAVKEGEKVTCQCERTDSSDVDVLVSWYDNATRDFATPDIVNNGSIFFTGVRNNKAVYYCKSRNIFGWESIHVYYQPTLLSGPDGTNIETGILVSIVEAVLLLISRIIVAFLCVKLRRYTHSKGHMSANENPKLQQIRENDDGYLTPINLTNINSGQQIRGDYDSIEQYHGYETISRAEP